MNTLCTVLLSLGLVGLCLRAEEPVPPKPADPVKTAEPAKKELPSLPWHLADFWWEFDAPIPHFETLDMDVTIDRDVPSTCNFYIAPCGLGELSGIEFYGGIQTNVFAWASKTDHRGVQIGKGGIFSRWGKKTLSVNQARGADDSHYEADGYEGDFVSVRRPYAWTKGTYTWSLRATDTETIDGKDFTWVSCFVTARDTGVQRFIGSLRFEGKDLTFWARHSAFVEVYDKAKKPQSDIPEVKVTFGYPRINGQAPKLKKATVKHPGPGEESASPDCCTAVAEGCNIVVTVGPIFERDAKDRKHELKLAMPETGK